ncbi:MULTISPECIES: DUF4097 family beta strand repeat-containing protein [Streptomycetaceae]|uniref:DUF4097 domain-containing protein n=1 Tax=Streptantibioticus cattleyicolor (strain ATCC 35852 / DSM 46488 / JCM 4925 / NBRC 14057 / NRRL 8057) TaxID=1003195 RepID=F8JYA6_STREN|nr:MULTISPECIES: DUF4097 family beta strand repeat-containing protein [Streptomycetaceae]AEW95900.1 hypothetical protein SCATT_35290 [Streptantibioticus cattleyicolor NRRL 8057 = DSM 46488]MYS60438.1 DUF4097 family beta strand repeat protein [Streptomyces sp. SID5468]CCB76236.1 conserved protein of unknown function [Streptantibioticus cattleyicolor NRRL 8057 = DSM 46488]
MTERTFVSQSAGPVVLGLDLPMGNVHVQVLDNLTTARVVVRTDDSSGPAADAVNRARSNQNGQALAIEVPAIPANVMMQSARGNRVTQTMGTVYGSVTGLTVVNGRIITGGGTGVMETVSPIEAIVSLPTGSSLAVVSTSADACAYGEVDSLEFRSLSGDLRADSVRTLAARTTSGDVSVGRVSKAVTVHSVSGDIRIVQYDGQRAELNTTSGDVTTQATDAARGALTAHSVSGDIHLSRTGHLRVSANSLSGRVRTH